MPSARELAMVSAATLLAFAAVVTTYHWLGRDHPFLRGSISAIAMAFFVFLTHRYGRRGPVEPRRQRVWFFTSLAAVGALAAGGLILLMAMART